MNPVNNNASLNSAPANDEEGKRVGYGSTDSVVLNDPAYVERNARLLMAHFGQSEQYLPFYCKVIYGLGPRRVFELMNEADARGNDPARYFNYLASKELKLGRFREGGLYGK